MPIWLRNYTFNEIKEFYDNQNKELNQSDNSNNPKISQPDINPTYNTKVSKN